jgi:hypothetical protein
MAGSVFLAKPGAARYQVQAFSASLPEAPAWSAAIAQLVEHVIRNDGVTGSNPVCGTSFLNLKPVRNLTKRIPCGPKSGCVISLTYPFFRPA